jgi:hypothetical protein
MGLFNEKREGIFVKISDGRLSYTTTAADPKAEVVTYTDDKTNEEKVTYKRFPASIEGFIVSAEYRKTQFGNILEIGIENEGQLALLQLKTAHSLTNYFVNMLHNADFEKAIVLTAWKWRDNTYFGITQDGEKLKYRYTKESGDGPQPTLTKDEMGADVYDWAPVRTFYAEYVRNVIAPKLEAIKARKLAAMGSDAPYVEAQKENKEHVENEASNFQQPEDAPGAPGTNDADDIPF